MARVICKVVRVGVIGALGLGAAALIAEAASPGSARAMARQAKQTVGQAISDRIEDPVALRAQLRDLELQYPRRIEAVRHDLAELNAQLQQFEQELAVTDRVVHLAEADLADLRAQLARAEEARATATGYTVVRLRHENRVLDLTEAYAKADRIQQLRDSYAARADEIKRDLGLLGEQQERLGGLLATLETERAQFQSQLWQLDRQIDAVARNERLIAMLEKRQRTLDEIGPFSASSLEHVTGRIARIRAEQESRMQALAGSGAEADYESRARVQVDATRGQGRPLILDVEPIEIGPESRDLLLTEPNPTN
jgi:chromosome segregation ATPase